MYKFINQYKFNENEVKFLMLIISQVEMQDQKHKQYIIHKSDFSEKIDFKEFLSKPLKIQEEDSFLIVNWFSAVESNDKLYKVSISEKLKPYILTLKRNYQYDELELIISQREVKTLKKKEDKKIVLKNDLSDEQLKIKRAVNFFDQERKKIQPNYVRKEYRNTDGEYMLRIHLRETGRTPEMFFDAIRWLFSNNPKAAFHRDYIMNIGKLIEHFNTLEHQAMHSKEAIKFNEEAQMWANIYKKQGMPENEILDKLREAGYIK